MNYDSEYTANALRSLRMTTNDLRQIPIETLIAEGGADDLALAESAIRERRKAIERHESINVVRAR